MSQSQQQEEQGYSSEEEWNSLDTEEQDEVLQEKLEDTQGTSEGDFEFAEMEADEQLSAIDRINDKLEETWHGVVLEDVSMEFYTLTQAQIDELKSLMTKFSQVADAESVEDLDDGTLEALDNADEVLNQLLADTTVDGEMDQEWWGGGDYPASLKMDAFACLMEHYKQEVGNVKSFQ